MAARAAVLGVLVGVDLAAVLPDLVIAVGVPGLAEGLAALAVDAVADGVLRLLALLAARAAVLLVRPDVGLAAGLAGVAVLEAGLAIVSLPSIRTTCTCAMRSRKHS